MVVKSWEEFVGSVSLFDIAATVGVFDGLHLGHQALIQTVLSREPAMRSCVVTFVQNPKDVLHKSSFKGNIFSLEQKLDSLASTGVELCVLIDFSPDFGKQSGEQFLSKLSQAGVRFLCIGPNFRCGHNMDTSAGDLVALGQKIGVQVAILEPVMYKGFPVSSSRVRKAILEGNLDEARSMLGRPYEIWLSKEWLSKDNQSRTSDDGNLGSKYCFHYDPYVVLPPYGVYNIGIEGNGSTPKLMRARITDGKICLPEIVVDSPVIRVKIFERVPKEA